MVYAAEPRLDDFKKCAAIGAPFQRTLRYDALLPPTAEPTQPTSEPESAWWGVETKSKINDAPEATVSHVGRPGTIVSARHGTVVANRQSSPLGPAPVEATDRRLHVFLV